MTETDISAVPTGETMPRRLVLFDGVCNLCCWSMHFLAAHYKGEALRFASVQSPIGTRLLQEHALPVTDYDSFVLIEDGMVRLKSAAIFALVADLNFPWPLLAVFRVLPRRWTDFLYDRVARNRYRVFGQRGVCLSPTALGSLTRYDG